MNTNPFGCLVVLTIAGLTSVACTAREAEPAQMPAETFVPNATAAEQPKAAQAAPLVSSGVLNVDTRIVTACGLPTPHFAFDSSKILDAPDLGLDKIAVCFVTGPLMGRSMRLVGHADPRGETEYNLALGQRRAGSVADYLVVRGVKESKLSSTSRGDLDATGTDEASWANDRRVDMILGD